MKNKRFIGIALLLPFLIAVFGQSCSPDIEFGEKSRPSSAPPTLHSGNGDTYDGKLRVLHHYIDNFTCEGRPAPESILVRKEDMNWYLTKNTPKKCAITYQLQVTGVTYDELAQQAYFDDKLYVPPRPYYVLNTENPNLPDIDLLDGICNDINGLCSLRAAIEQGVTTSLTEPVVVEIPPGTYNLTSAIQLLGQYRNTLGIKLRGTDPATTIIDGGGTTSHLKLGYLSAAKIEISNLTFQNGLGQGGFNASSITFLAVTHRDTNSEIKNCIFRNNSSFAAVAASPGAGHIFINESQFINNNQGIYVYRASSLSVENSIFKNNTSVGLNVSNHTANVTVRQSSFFNNFRGASFNNCANCLIENTSIYDNTDKGLTVGAFLASSYDDFDITVNNSTIYNNGLSSGTNLSVYFEDPIDKLILNNSIIAMGSVSRPNCAWSGTYSHTIVATNSIFDDATCEASGTGNLFTNPLLGLSGNYGGKTPTLMPLPTSPAIDSGSNSFCSTTDQRGFLRPVDHLGNGAQCDIGAVELQ